MNQTNPEEEKAKLNTLAPLLAAVISSEKFYASVIGGGNLVLNLSLGARLPLLTRLLSYYRKIKKFLALLSGIE